MPRKAASPPAKPAKRAAPTAPAKPAAPSPELLPTSDATPSTNTIASVAPTADRRTALEAIRDRLAFETDDTLWAKHKNECHCVCGMGDGRLLVALVKELRAVITELDSLPNERKESSVDKLAARFAATRDELADRRTSRGEGTAVS